jgi:dephospho-CoA kinase
MTKSQTRLLKVAVTGGLGSGKTTVCRLFKDLGAYVVSADQIVHELLTPDTELGKKAISLLGEEIVDGHQLNRLKIAQKVFSQRQLLRILEEMIHPAVFKEIENRYQRANQEEHRYSLFVAEIPLLYEARAEASYDVTVCVIADPMVCKSRLEKERQQAIQDFEARSQRQMNPQAKASRADYTIENNGSLEDLKKKVEQLNDVLLNPQMKEF